LDNLKKAELDETLVYEIPIKVSSCLERVEDVPPIACVLSPIDPPPAFNPLICCTASLEHTRPMHNASLIFSEEVLQPVNMDIFSSKIRSDYLWTTPKFCDCIDEVCCNDFGVTIVRVCLHSDYMTQKPINASVYSNTERGHLVIRVHMP